MIAVHTPFWWINHPWRPCLLCNVPYHQGRRCLATLHMLLHERIHPLKVAWKPRLAMFIVCVACEFEECTDHVPIVSNVSYSSVFGRDSLHVRPQLSDNIPESKNKCLKILHPTISYNIPQWYPEQKRDADFAPAEGKKHAFALWAPPYYARWTASQVHVKCQIQLWPFTSYKYL